jgi:hypothetical protein
MGIRIQNYEWTLRGNGTYVATDYPEAGVANSVFVGPYGNRVEIPPFVKETEFVVIHQFGSTSGVLAKPSVSGTSLTSWTPNSFVQIVLNTTGYYQDPQNTFSGGISGDAAPYPWTVTDVPPSYELRPPIYVLPEQTWDFRITLLNDLRNYAVAAGITDIPESTILARCFVQYHLFDGPDALICHQLMEMGIPITVDNVEWYKHLLLRSRGLDTQTWEYYLAAMQAYRERDEYYEKYGARTRKA